MTTKEPKSAIIYTGAGTQPFGPFEGFGAFVVAVDVVSDRSLEFGNVRTLPSVVWLFRRRRMTSVPNVFGRRRTMPTAFAELLPAQGLPSIPAYLPRMRTG